MELKAPTKESHISVASAEQGMAAAEGSLAEGSPAEQDSPVLGGSLGAAVGTPAAAVAGQVVGTPAVQLKVLRRQHVVQRSLSCVKDCSLRL